MKQDLSYFRQYNKIVPMKTKSESLKKMFSGLNLEQRYEKLIEMGRALAEVKEEYRVPENKVLGCQSTVYLHTELKDGKLYFSATADALISAGLAAVLIYVYNGETPENVIKVPPLFIKELNLSASLSPSRSNGLGAIHLRMQQDALKFLVKK